MTFLVSLNEPTRGSYLLGFLKIENSGLTQKDVCKQAQRRVVEMLVEAGFERSKIGLQVTDYTSIEIGSFRVYVVPIKEFDGAVALTLSALLR